MIIHGAIWKKSKYIIIDMITNNAIFSRIWRKIQPYGLAFVSSNGGTGKTVYFKMRLLRDAVERHIPFHIFVRFKNEMEQAAYSYLDIKPTYSRRQRRLIDRCAVKKVDDNFIYIVDAEDDKRIYAQVVNVHGQAFYKKIGNTIGAKRAFFDEILAEDGHYCPNEVNKFNRLVFTMARGDDYHVYALYNNTSPNFDYFSFFGGKTFNTHVSASGALFVFFTARQYSTREEMSDARSVQSILQRTTYADVYCNNTFAEFPNFCRPTDLKGSSVVCNIEIENQRFKVRLKGKYVYIDRHCAHKETRKPIYSINDHERTTLRQIPEGLRCALCAARDKSLIKTADLRDTIFVKILCEKL